MTDFSFGKGGVVMFRKIARHLIVLNVQAVIRHAALVDVSCFQSGYFTAPAIQGGTLANFGLVTSVQCAQHFRMA